MSAEGEVTREALIHWCKWLGVLTVVGFVTFVLTRVALPQETKTEHHSNPWLLSWIPAPCCVTNDCCWEISERELIALPDDNYEVRSTGQVRKRTGWSPDGKFYRCACDYDAASRQWNRHQGANTRCLFVPFRAAERTRGLGAVAVMRAM